MTCTRTLSPVGLIASVAAAILSVAACRAAELTVFGNYEYERFSRDLDPWKLATIELSAKSDRGTILGRVQEADRFGIRGRLVEVDAYPKFSKTTYAYLNAGGSNSTIFPHRRYGAELYHVFQGGYETSAGVRSIDFGGRSTIYTGSFGRYWGQYWASLRPYVVRRDAGTLSSASATLRRYFATADDYLSLDVLRGQIPGDPLVARELGLARWSAGLQLQRAVGRTLLRGRIATESLSAGSSPSRRGLIVSGGIGRRF